MKILHVVHGYPPSMGGVQVLMKNLSEELVARHGDSVTVFTTNAYRMEYFAHGGPPSETMPAGLSEQNGVTVRRFPVFARFNFLRRAASAAADRLHLPGWDWLRTLHNGPLLFGLRRAVAESQAEVVMAASFPLLHMYLAQQGAQAGQIPLVLLGAIHPTDPWAFERPLMFRAIERCAAYIALTPYERDYLIGRGIDPAKIEVIGAGIDPTQFVGADGTALRTQWGWGERPLVCSVAKQTPRKRLEVLLQAMRSVWHKHPAAILVLAGAEGPATNSLKAQIGALPPAQQAQVVLLNDISEAEKADLLTAADVFVLPSGEESFGIAFLEAWACGTPVIGVAGGAVGSLIAEGQDGLLMPYGDADALANKIIYLLDNPDLGQHLGLAGQRKVEQEFTWASISQQFRAVYQRVQRQSLTAKTKS